MTTAVDSNVLVALWDLDPQLNTVAETALENAQSKGALVATGVVYTELLALPSRTEMMLDKFFIETGIRIEWELSEPVWREAGRAFQGYISRRKSRKDEFPRRILADFLIGAHAAVHHYRLLTFDQRLYQAAFPNLEIIAL
jgi:predicted nucleic acid-binding protein